MSLTLDERTKIFDKVCRLVETKHFTLASAASGEQLFALTAHSAPVMSVAWSPDGKQLTSAGADGIVQVYAVDLHCLMALARQRVTSHPSGEEKIQKSANNISGLLKDSFVVSRLISEITRM